MLDHYELEQMSFKEIKDKLGWTEDVAVGDLVSVCMALCSKMADVLNEVEKQGKAIAVLSAQITNLEPGEKDLY